MSELTPLSLDDYEAIAEAVQETERGRWFLSEYARRNRSADTEVVLEAIAGLSKRMSRGRRRTAKAARHVEEALRLIASMRADRRADADQNLAAIESVLVLALEALGAGREQPTEAPSAAPPAEARPAEALAPTPLALAPPTQPVETEDRADAAAAVDAEEPAPRDGEPSPERARLVAIASEPPPQPRVEDVVEAPTRPVAVRRPGLLESLSDAEKAILFA